MEMVHFIPSSQRRLVLEAALGDGLPVWITGESGTGKGNIAKWIHTHGPRSAMPFVEASPRSLKKLTQLFQETHGGTLLLLDLPQWSGADLKIIFQYLKTKTLPLDPFSGILRLLNVRLILTSETRAEVLDSPTLSDLGKKLEEGFVVEMPSLASRGAEFEDIASGILQEILRELHREYIKGFSTSALEKLKAYRWPGNLRELRNVLRLAAITAKGGRIECEDLPDFGLERIELRATREQFEKIYLQELMKQAQGKIETASRVARIDSQSLKQKLKFYQIEIESRESLDSMQQKNRLLEQLQDP